jgi:hypothetical protein
VICLFNAITWSVKSESYASCWEIFCLHISSFLQEDQGTGLGEQKQFQLWTRGTQQKWLLVDINSMWHFLSRNLCLIWPRDILPSLASRSVSRASPPGYLLWKASIKFKTEICALLDVFKRAMTDSGDSGNQNCLQTKAATGWTSWAWGSGQELGGSLKYI